MFSEKTKNLITVLGVATITVLIATPFMFIIDAQNKKNKKAFEAHIQKEEELVEATIISNGSETFGGYKKFPASQSNTTLVELQDGTRWKVNEMIGNPGEKIQIKRWQLSKHVSTITPK